LVVRNALRGEPYAKDLSSSRIIFRDDASKFNLKLNAILILINTHCRQLTSATWQFNTAAELTDLYDYELDSATVQNKTCNIKQH